MSKRLTRIHTGTGDNGTTGLADGSRLDKDAARIAAIGDVDELNCVVGILLAQPAAAEFHAQLTTLQHWLFDLGGSLAIPTAPGLDPARGQATEQLIDALNATLPALEEFVLPGGNMAAAYCHQARAVCRRAERSLVRLAHGEPVGDGSLVFLNRLSDLFFVMARHLARTGGGREPTWRRDAQLTIPGAD